MANFTALAAARHRVLSARGLGRRSRTGCTARRACGSSPARSATRRSTSRCAISASVERRAELVAVDEQGRMRADALRDGLGDDGRPADDRLRAGRQREHRARSTRSPRSATPRTSTAHGCTSTARSACGPRSPKTAAGLVAGVERADSWATDAHKWLNVPYDCGIVIARHADAHRGAMTTQAAYLVQGGVGAPPDPFDWVPEFSRRAAASPCTRSSARSAAQASPNGSRSNCAMARRFAERLGASRRRRDPQRCGARTRCSSGSAIPMTARAR